MIRVINGISNELLCEVRARSTTTVKDLKALIAEATSVHLREQRLLWGGRSLGSSDGLEDVLAGQAPVRLVRVQPTWHAYLDMVAETGLMLGLDTDTQRTLAMRLLDADRGFKKGQEEQEALAKLFQDRSFVLAAVQENGGALHHASPELQDDREVVLCALRENGASLEFASEKLRGDREVVLTALRWNGKSLQFAAEELRGDREIVNVALLENGEAYRFASEELRFDRELALKAVTRTASALTFVVLLFQNDYDFILEAVRLNADVLRYVRNAELCKDQEIVRAAQAYWLQVAAKVDSVTSPKRSEPFLMCMDRDRARNYEWQMKCGGGALGLRQHP